MADLYTPRDAAERLGISYPTIKQWLYRGKLRAVKTPGKRIVFSGDTNGEGLAKNADILVAHNAIPEDATGLERRLHMPPSVIGTTAANAHVKQLVLSHRMLRTLGKEEETQTEVRHRYAGPIAFANDLDCFPRAT